MKSPNLYQLTLASFALLTVLACNVLAPVPTATPSPVPATPTIVPTSMPVSLSGQVTLISSPLSETNQTPPYTITVRNAATGRQR